MALRNNGGVFYLLGDHLGSTSVTANSSGTVTGRLWYHLYGETRYSWGTTPTARRFVQADTVVPGAGNPSKHIDQSEHTPFLASNNIPKP